MYALIYDEYDPEKPLKKVISLHQRRATAESALEKRMKRLQKRVWDCQARIVWVNGRVRTGAFVDPKLFSTWRPGEKIPYGELYSDSD